MSAFTQSVLLQVGINVLLAVGYWIAVSTGRYSFGHVGFVAIGAYTSAILTTNFSWSLPTALLAAAVAAAVGGVLVGFIALRLPMLYLAIITLAFSSVIVIIANEWEYVGGPIGMFGMEGTTIPIVVVCLVIVVAYVLLLSRSRLGLAYAAIREDDQAAKASGIRVTRVAVSAFATSAAVTGVAGALVAHQQGVIQPAQFGPQASLLVILYVVFGGVEYFWGAALGAVVLTLLPIYFNWLSDWYQIVYGLLFVALMIVRPQGLIGRSSGRSRLAGLTRLFQRSRQEGETVG
jgi:branched-chain amino acid transport system permease protein